MYLWCLLMIRIFLVSSRTFISSIYSRCEFVFITEILFPIHALFLVASPLWRFVIPHNIINSVSKSLFIFILYCHNSFLEWSAHSILNLGALSNWSKHPFPETLIQLIVLNYCYTCGHINCRLRCRRAVEGLFNTELM